MVFGARRFASWVIWNPPMVYPAPREGCKTLALGVDTRGICPMPRMASRTSFRGTVLCALAPAWTAMAVGITPGGNGPRVRR